MFNENWYPDSQCSSLIQLVKCVSELKGNVIEIGCWEGKSTINIANACHPSTLICNDTWLGNIGESKIIGYPHITEIILKNRDVFSIFINNMENNTQKNYKIVREDCLTWLKNFIEPIKFIHIDASHDYFSVSETIKLVLPNMVKYGIICGDDFINANIHREDLNGGVEKAVRELLPGFKNEGNLWYWMKT